MRILIVLLVLVLAPPARVPASAPEPTPYASWLASGRDFLSLDPAHGTAGEGVGDLAAATRVVVVVPGVGTKLRDFDRGLGGVTRRAPAMQARTVYSALRQTDPRSHV